METSLQVYTGRKIIANLPNGFWEWGGIGIVAVVVILNGEPGGK